MLHFPHNLKKFILSTRLSSKYSEEIAKKEIVNNHPLQKMVENFAIPMALYGSMATMPQAIEVLFFKQTAGVSIITFGLFLFGNFFWFSYGKLHNDKPIMVSHLSTGLLNFLIVLGVILSHIKIF
jgi:uncharacterized protein with PQ loop repeat